MPQDTKSSDRSSASGNGLVDPSQLLPDQFDSIKVGERDFCDLPNGFPDGDEEMTNKQDTLEPIAVIGIALKFPQDATSPEAFWEMLIQGRSALTEIPRDRFNLDAFWSENSEIAGTVQTKSIICSKQMPHRLDCLADSSIRSMCEEVTLSKKISRYSMHPFFQ